MGQAAQKRHILVINDTQEILDLFREILEEEGYRVSLYSYAFRDLDEIKQGSPDLIILDFIIGGEDYGWQLLQKRSLIGQPRPSRLSSVPPRSALSGSWRDI